MLKIQTCEYNDDNDSIKVQFDNGKIIILLCEGIESQLKTSIITSSRLEWLKENDLNSYVEMYLTGKMQDYLNLYASNYADQQRTIEKQLENTYDKTWPKKWHMNL